MAGNSEKGNPRKDNWYLSDVTISTRSKKVPELLLGEVGEAKRYIDHFPQEAAALIGTVQKGDSRLDLWQEGEKRDLQVYMVFEDSHGVVGTYTMSHRNGLYVNIAGCDPEIRKKSNRDMIMDLVFVTFPPVRGYEQKMVYNPHRF